MPSWSAIALYGVTLTVAYIARYTFVLSPLLRSDAHTSLSFPSSEFSGLRYWSLFVYFITRSLIRRLPLFAPPPIQEGSSRSDNGLGTGDHGKGHSATIPGPRISLEIPFHCTAADIIRYNRAAKTSGIDTPSHPLHLMLFLSAATEPAMLLLLSKINCPVDPVGAVNVRNRFELVDMASLGEELKEVVDVDMETDGNEAGAVVQDWKAVARLDPNVKKVKKGWEIMIVVELVTNSGRVLFRQFFTFLQFAKHRIPFSTEDHKPAESTVERGWSSDITVNMVNGDPGLWAELSKDYNPIHFSTTVARLFGFRSKIAHGNHVLAKGLAKIPESTEIKGITTLDVEFKRPVFVPSTLDVWLSTGKAGGAEVALGIKGKDHVVARYSRSKEQM